MHTYNLLIGGLKGGHSGMEINKERGNANKLIGRLLNDIANQFNIYICNVTGGVKSNAIPRESEAVIQVNEQDVQKIQELTAKWDKIFKNELRATDNGVFAKLEKANDTATKTFSAVTTKNLIATLMIIPNGIQSMSMEIPDLVESSTNIGVMQVVSDEIYLVNEVRSSIRTLKYKIREQIEIIAKTFGGKLEIDSDYPEWEYNPDSKLRQVFMNVHKEKYNKEAEIIAIHAGLECGVLIEKMEGLDAISLGPNLFDVHTPNEHLSISSTKNVWEYLLEVLKNMK
jgi:dipeptidase D